MQPVRKNEYGIWKVKQTVHHLWKAKLSTDMTATQPESSVCSWNETAKTNEMKTFFQTRETC